MVFGRHVLRHLDKVIRDQTITPVVIDQSHFFLDRPGEQPGIGERRLWASRCENLDGSRNPDLEFNNVCTSHTKCLHCLRDPQ